MGANQNKVERRGSVKEVGRRGRTFGGQLLYPKRVMRVIWQFYGTLVLYNVDYLARSRRKLG